MISFFDSNVTLSPMVSSLDSQLELIAEDIYKNRNRTEDSGLLGGKSGITLLYAYLSEVFPNRNYLEVTSEFLNELSNALSDKELPHNMYTKSSTRTK